VKVVFPYFDLGPVLQVTGGSANTEKAQDAINAYVSEINAQGGIYCRKIDPIVVQFNPLDDTEMDVYCRKWAQDDKVFAVVDSDAWHSTHQLCLTQDHHIPLLTGLGLTEQWPQRGAPYLWYAGATAEMTVDNWALSAQQHGHLDSGHHIGVILSDREEEHIGGARLKADLARLGRTGDNAPVYEEVPYDAAQAQPFINKAVNDFKIAKVDRLFMMLPFTTFSTFVKTAEQQNFYPKYLVSDFQSNIVTAQAVLSQLYPRSMEGAEGPSMVRLGLYDDQKLGNYVAAERRCDAIWKKHEPANQRHAGHGGIAMRWCDHITQFAEALRLAGPDPTRQKWTAAIATVHGYAAAMTPTLTWNPGVYAGAQVVAEYVVHLGEGPGKCPHDVFYEDGNGNGSCHVMTEAYRPYRTFG
jgi:hypothetical protein